MRSGSEIKTWLWGQNVTFFNFRNRNFWKDLFIFLLLLWASFLYLQLCYLLSHSLWGKVEVFVPIFCYFLLDFNLLWWRFLLKEGIQLLLWEMAQSCCEGVHFFRFLPFFIFKMIILGFLWYYRRNQVGSYIGHGWFVRRGRFGFPLFSTFSGLLIGSECFFCKTPENASQWCFVCWWMNWELKRCLWSFGLRDPEALHRCDQC